MRKLILLILVCLLLIAPAAQSQENGFPACTELESLIFIISLFDPALRDIGEFKSIADFVDYASNYLESRESDITLVPLCGVAIELQRQGLAFKGDLFGQFVLQLAEVPAAADPYAILVPDNDERLAMNEERLAGEEFQEEPVDRQIPACSMSEMFRLDSLASQLDVTYARALNLEGAEKWLLANYQILKWREEKLAALPHCLEAIEVGLLLTKLATDSAAQFAFKHAGFTDAHNPFIEAVNSRLGMLQSWRDHVTLTRPEHAGAKVLVLGEPSQLPPCRRADIDLVHSAIQEDVLPLLKTTETPENEERLAEYAESHMELRYGFLSEAPACAEIFEGLWLARELLGGRLAWASFNAFGYIGPINPFGKQVQSKTSRLKAWVNKTGLLRAGPSRSPGEETALEAPACRSGELDLAIAYLMVEYDDFMEGLFGKGDDFDILTSIEESFALRDKLWEQMPRCQEVLEIGLMMRQIAGDLMSTISMKLADVETADVPYGREGRRDMDLIDELRDEIMAAATAAVGLGAQTYYVTANPYANIRACASTDCAIVARAQNGEAITVLDDSSDWYEIRLKDGGTGYIAGFLASKSRP